MKMYNVSNLCLCIENFKSKPKHDTQKGYILFLAFYHAGLVLNARILCTLRNDFIEGYPYPTFAPTDFSNKPDSFFESRW